MKELRNHFIPSLIYKEQPSMSISFNRNSSTEHSEKFEKPTTQYAKSSGINIAYQVFGNGPIDLVYIPGWISNIDWVWACPELVQFLIELGKTARVILFDKRGTGLSDRVVELSTLEERMDDIRAVMDAAHSKKAVLFGHSEGGCVSALFAATYPNRVLSLITFGIFAKRRYSPDYPWAPTDEERQKTYDMIENNWGNEGEMGLQSLAPSKAQDPKFMKWLANYFRSGASPGAAMMLTKMNTQVDITNILKSINVPTLVMQRTHDIDVKVEEGKFIADRIKDAQFVALEGNDHLFWAGDTTEILRHMKAFIQDERPNVNHEKQLLTIIVARMVHNFENNEASQRVIMKIVEKYHGRLFQNDYITLIATFEGPSKAVQCSMDLMDAMKNVGTQMSIGVHISEVAFDEKIFADGETKDFVDSILDMTRPNEILITQTVKYLLSGTGFSFTQQDLAFKTASGDSLPLFTVGDPNYLNTSGYPTSKEPKDSFFELVLACIDDHLSEEDFTLKMLCKHIGISERQLQRKLKTITNKSPNQLISSVRLHRAKALILSNKYNISEVAFQTGFSSPSYFSKRFKMEFGISPSSLVENNY